MPRLQDNNNCWLDGLLQGWAEAEQQQDETKDCPTILRLWLHETEGRSLGDFAEHVQPCSRCHRRLRSIRREIERIDTKKPAAGVPWVRSALSPVARHWRASLGSVAAAAVLVFAAVAFFQYAQPARADEALLRQIAIRLVFLPIADPFVSDDPSALASRLAEIDQLKVERDQFLRFAASSSDFEARQKANHDTMQPWHGVYRRLRDIGRFDEAIIEAQKLIAYIQADTDLRNPHGPLKSTLADLGNIYLAMSDFANARAAYAASIAERQEYVRVTSLDPPEHPDNIGNPIQTLVPLYWSMSNVAIAEDNLGEAREWMDRGDEAFLGYFAGICCSNGIDIPDNAGLVAAYRAAPRECQTPLEHPSEAQLAAFAATYHGWKPNSGLVTKLRAHLYYKARLALAEGNTAQAQYELDAGRTVAYYACHDEDRLDFNEPLLAARIAIAEKRYREASALIAEAEQHTGLPSCSDQANNRPIVSARIAELTLLKGVALLGLNQSDEEAAHLIEQALAVPEKLAAGLPVEQRKTFLSQFVEWTKLARGHPQPMGKE